MRTVSFAVNSVTRSAPSCARTDTTKLESGCAPSTYAARTSAGVQVMKNRMSDVFAFAGTVMYLSVPSRTPQVDGTSAISIRYVAGGTEKMIVSAGDARNVVSTGSVP